jgi:hypothetical protein
MACKQHVIAILLLLSFAIIIPSFFMLSQMGPKIPSDHLAIIDQTTVKATISSAIVVNLTPVLIGANTQTLQALDLFDLVKKAQWYQLDFPMTQWSWQYKGQTLLYMQIWGPKITGSIITYYVQFSKATFSGMTINCKGQIFNFEVAMAPQSEGFAYIWITL